MAIKKRALIKLDTTKNHILHAVSVESKEALGKVYRDLTEVRDLYREGLPRHDYTAYEEIYDGLILAVRAMIEDGATSFHREELILCQELLQYLEGKTEKEIHFKKELVFLPYKSAMWDSLESVWKAACEDTEHCKAYVMPIPYVDKNLDGSVAAYHCERDQFPPYVPTLDYRQIDLKAWHPDVIFYHNPYDEYNLVTSVDSRYYSQNLKLCADELVYIPYFVLDEPHPGNEAEEEGLAHFILTVGVFNADKVIVQSEAMREVYINVLTKGTNKTDRAYWEKRISGAGSPKIEKVLTSKREDFDMPDRWREVIADKKVILYNTSVGAMLEKSDEVCAKLRYIFDVFHNRDDVVLWWRPHPLMKSTLHSMRPEIETEYLQIEQQYIAGGWGVYDDTPDLHRAICWSDAYYGDSSSVITLYLKTRKPILIEDIETHHYKEYRCFVEHFTVERDMAWFVSSRDVVPVLCKVDLQNGDLSFLGELPIENIIYNDYATIGKVENKIIIAPYANDTNFIEYNLENKRFFVKNLSNLCIGAKLTIQGFCTNVIKHERSLFFVVNENGYMIEYCGDTGDYIRREIWNQEWPLKKEEMLFSTERYIKYENKAYLPVMNTTYILEIDFLSYQVFLHKIPMEGYELASCSFDGKKFYIIPVDGNVLIVWEKGSTRTNHISVPWEKYDRRNRFAIHVHDEPYLYVLPRSDSNIFRINKNTMEFCWSESALESRMEPQTEHYTGVFQPNADEFYLYLYQDGMIKHFNRKTKEINDIKIKFCWEKMLRCYSQSMSPTCINAEEFGTGLECFLDCVLQHKEYMNRTVKDYGEVVGKCIYEACKIL